MMDMTPAHASHEVFPRVRIEQVKESTAAATTTKIAVQAIIGYSLMSILTCRDALCAGTLFLPEAQSIPNALV